MALLKVISWAIIFIARIIIIFKLKSQLRVSSFHDLQATSFTFGLTFLLDGDDFCSLLISIVIGLAHFYVWIFLPIIAFGGQTSKTPSF